MAAHCSASRPPSATERGGGSISRLTLAFDFDNTVIACNSDTAIPRSCDGGAHAPSFDAGLAAFEGSWTTFMDDSLATMAADGATVDQIAAAAREIRIDEGFAETLREISAMPSTRLLIISDANTLFIDEILKANDLDGVFAPLITNPSAIVTLTAEEASARRTAADEGGAGAGAGAGAGSGPAKPPAPTRLAVEPYTAKAGAHSCPTCPANLCKTAALRAQCGMANAAGRPAEGVGSGRYVYCGDGSNDVCPSVTLLDRHDDGGGGGGDIVLARAGFSLATAWRKRHGAGTSRPPTRGPDVKEWADWAEFTALLRAAAGLPPLPADDRAANGEAGAAER